MLYIKEGTFKGEERRFSWHVGEPLPLPNGQVISFQADGDELLVILSALKETIPLRNRPKQEDYL